MPAFDIVKKSSIKQTFRTQKIACDFDFGKSEICERFSGSIDFPESWNIGMIVGNSGTGKSTIAKQLFGGGT